jgi:hypothetical protein
MQFDDFDTQVQCEEVYDNYLDFIEFNGAGALYTEGDFVDFEKEELIYEIY